jgi:pyruvate/2-oxoacid:ferredoxin oxidoreductase alpha subunit
LWPISERLKNLAPQFESIIVVEMNDGQLFNLLKAESVQKLQSLTQVSGKPIRVSYLLEKFQKILKSGK